MFNWNRGNGAGSSSEPNADASQAVAAESSGGGTDRVAQSEPLRNRLETGGSSPNGAVSQSDYENGADGVKGLVQQRKQMVERIGHLRPETDAYATEFVDQLLAFAGAVKTSDVHLQPTARGLEV